MLKFPRTIVGVLFVSCLVIPAARSWGWIDCGHQIVALVAWDDLSPKTKAACTALLKQHARYKEDLLNNIPTDTPADEVDRYVFARAATWPDIVRSQSNPMHTLYHHPNWHYTDIPFVVGGVAVPENKNADGPAPHDVVEAINKSKIDVISSTVSGPEQAVALCWIEHCIGDIHQPLHCASMFSPEFPDGDQGGNLQIVLRDPPYTNTQMNLHLLWDSMPGQFLSGTIDVYMASGVRSDPRYTREKLKDLIAITDPMAWAHEGYDLAVKYVYLNGNLKTAAAAKKGAAVRGQIPGVPPGYVARGENLAMHQVALGGYRLADTLNAIFDPHP